METTFENAQVGDRVWDEDLKLFGIVVERHPSKIVVDLKLLSFISYSFLGTMEFGVTRTLYWDKLVIPCRPKRKVKKVVEGWINIYSGNTTGGTVHETKDSANTHHSSGRLGTACFIHHEYEVEE